MKRSITIKCTEHNNKMHRTISFAECLNINRRTTRSLVIYLPLIQNRRCICFCNHKSSLIFFTHYLFFNIFFFFFFASRVLISPCFQQTLTRATRVTNVSLGTKTPTNYKLCHNFRNKSSFALVFV